MSCSELHLFFNEHHQGRNFTVGHHTVMAKFQSKFQPCLSPTLLGWYRKRGEIHYMCGHDSFSLVRLLATGPTRFSLRASVSTKWDVIYTIAGCVVFLIMYIPIIPLLYNQLQLSSVAKLSFRLTNILCVIYCIIHTGSKNNFSFIINYHTYFFWNKIQWRSTGRGSSYFCHMLANWHH